MYFKQRILEVFFFIFKIIFVIFQNIFVILMTNCLQVKINMVHEEFTNVYSDRIHLRAIAFCTQHF